MGRWDDSDASSVGDGDDDLELPLKELTAAEQKALRGCPSLDEALRVAREGGAQGGRRSLLSLGITAGWQGKHWTGARPVDGQGLGAFDRMSVFDRCLLVQKYRLRQAEEARTRRVPLVRINVVDEFGNALVDAGTEVPRRVVGKQRQCAAVADTVAAAASPAADLVAVASAIDADGAAPDPVAAAAVPAAALDADAIAIVADVAAALPVRVPRRFAWREDWLRRKAAKADAEDAAEAARQRWEEEQRAVGALASGRPRWW